MIYSVAEVKKPRHTDSQRQSFYDFDHILKDEIAAQGTRFPKLYRDLDENASIQELSNHISEDFGLLCSELFVSNDSSSYYQMGKIWIHPIARKQNDIEVLLHEYAHLFHDYFFKSESAQPHGGEYVAVFRWLLDFYDIVPKSDFDEALTYFGEDVDLFEDHIETLTFMSENELNSLFHSLKEQDNEEYISGIWSTSGQLERNYISTEKQIHHFMKNKESGKFIYSCVNKCAYDYETPFSNLTKEEFENTIIVSSAYLMGYSGEKITSRYCPRYYGYVELDGSTAFNPLRGFSSDLVKLGDDETPEEKKLITKQITEYVKTLKKDGVNVIRAKSEKEYVRLCNLMKKRYWEIRKEGNLIAA